MQSRSDPSPELPSGLWLLTRPECGLCDAFLDELREFAAGFSLPPVIIVDVDDHPELARRHGLDIPVLLWDGVMVCQHRFDGVEVKRLLRPRQAPAPL